MKNKILQISKWSAALSAAVLMLPFLGSAQTTESADVFMANADTYLRSTNPDGGTNYGANTTMFVRNSTSAYHQMGLVRFDLTGFNLPANVQLDSAKVFLTVGGTLSAAADVRVISIDDSYDGWDELGITWNSYKAGDLDTIGTIATTRVTTRGAQYSWDVTSHIENEVVYGNKIVSLALFQNYNTGANTTFVTRDSVTDDANKPHLILYTHEVEVKVIDLVAAPDAAGSSVQLDWKTATESNTDYAVVERSTDGVNFTEISSQLPAQGTSTDTTAYAYTDNSPVMGYTNYYRIKYVLTDNTTYSSEVLTVPMFKSVEAIEDTYVQLGNSGANHGLESRILVKNDGNSTYSRISFIKFDLSGYTGTPQAVKLHLSIFGANGSFPASTIWYLWNVEDDSWSETVITGRDYPSLSDSTQIVSSLPGTTVGPVEFEVPLDIVEAAMAADGILSLAITSNNINSTDDVSFVSRDTSDASLRPQLLISEDPADNVTPVTLSELQASLGGSTIVLTWKAFTELGTDRFEIERSGDGSAFVKIGELPARGTATGTKTYTFTDVNPLSGVNYYRVKAVDLNGVFSYTNIASHRSNAAALTAWKLFPNPVLRGQSISLSGAQGAVAARIVDFSGRVLSVQQLNGAHQRSVQTTGLASGVYYVQLLGEGGISLGQAQKVIIR